ncbi:hypothetical protein BDZ91DRAFT_793167 [Kalaharituber pfeilii]|nr:hypothetical protein BDZ91DRAFT_793167 [Kalaharituber pfeilii]
MSLRNTGPETDLDDVSFEAILSYDWDSDMEFQTGVQQILASASSPEQADELTLQAKCYYYSRKSNIPISFDFFKQYLSKKSRPSQFPESPVARALKPGFDSAEHRTPPPINPNTLQISSTDPPPTPSATIPGPPPPTPLTPGISTSPSSHDKAPYPTPTSPSSNNAAPYPTSFAHIVELITTGQPIPGIREIPNKLSEEKPSESVQTRRKKPWEQAAETGISTIGSAEGGAPADATNQIES